MMDYVSIQIQSIDPVEGMTWHNGEANSIFKIVDTLSSLFEATLEAETQMTWRHEWDDGLMFYSDDEGAERFDETQMSPKLTRMRDGLRALVTLYLDANSKV